MTVSALVTRNDITATASQTSFTYTFRVLEATDMDVYQNGALLASGYTVNNVGDTGGTVDITAGVPDTQIVSLVLAMPLDRTTNYQNSGDFLASDVNADFDKIYIGGIQNENSGDRSLRLQDVEPTIAMTLPLKADRVGKYLKFNATTGVPEAAEALASSGTPASATATGITGTINWDSSYIYICIATNTWKRTSIASW
jgi:hypothetical protein